MRDFNPPYKRDQSIPASKPVFWTDLRVPAQNTRLNPSHSEPQFLEFTDGLFLYKFSTANSDTDSVHFVAQLPHSYKEGSDIHPHIHWAPDNADTGDVRWQFEYIIANRNETFPSVAISETITEAADGIALNHQRRGFSVIDGTGITISAMIICRLTRLSSSDVLDTYNGNACFLEFDFHIQQDILGSLTELIK